MKTQISNKMSRVWQESSVAVLSNALVFEVILLIQLGTSVNQQIMFVNVFFELFILATSGFAHAGTRSESAQTFTNTNALTTGTSCFKTRKSIYNSFAYGF